MAGYPSRLADFGLPRAGVNGAITRGLSVHAFLLHFDDASTRPRRDELTPLDLKLVPQISIIRTKDNFPQRVTCLRDPALMSAWARAGHSQDWPARQRLPLMPALLEHAPNTVAQVGGPHDVPHACLECALAARAARSCHAVGTFSPRSTYSVACNAHLKVPGCLSAGNEVRGRTIPAVVVG